MRLRTFMRDLRGSRSLSEAAAAVGIAKGHLSMFERGHEIPSDAQAARLERVYGHPACWYPAGVADALQPDIRRCPGCSEELPPGASRRRVYHDDACRRQAARQKGAATRPTAEEVGS